MADSGTVQTASNRRLAAVGSRYSLLMLCLPLAVAAIGGFSMLITGGTLHLSDAVPYAAAVLIVVNLIGARAMFSPVARLIGSARTGSHDRAWEASAKRRIDRLPRWSGFWAFAMTVVALVPHHYTAHVLCEDCPTGLPESLQLYPLFLMTAYATLLGIAMYFIVDDYTSTLRAELTARMGIRFDPGHGRVRRKLVLAFMATSVLPIALISLHNHLKTDLSTLETERRVTAGAEDHHHPMSGMGTQAALQADVVAALLLAGIAIVFITRSMTRPFRALVRSMKRVSAGDRLAQVPVISSDEVGELTARFNDMLKALEEQALIRETFGRFVPEPVAAAVIADQGVLEPQVREATILFADIEGFTALAEALSPEEVLTVLNEYFSLTAQPIQAHGGVITQFQGDAILATFNLPVEQPRHAVAAVRASEEIRHMLQEHDFANGVHLRTRIGINTGVVVGGTVGGGERLGYTVHGDAVNLAARLEQVNKHYGTHLLIAERTAELVGEDIPLERIGEVTVHGRKRPVTVYAPPIDAYAAEGIWEVAGGNEYSKVADAGR